MILGTVPKTSLQPRTLAGKSLEGANMYRSDKHIAQFLIWNPLFVKMSVYTANYEPSIKEQQQQQNKTKLVEICQSQLTGVALTSLR